MFEIKIEAKISEKKRKRVATRRRPIVEGCDRFLSKFANERVPVASTDIFSMKDREDGWDVCKSGWWSGVLSDWCDGLVQCDSLSM